MAKKTKNQIQQELYNHTIASLNSVKKLVKLCFHSGLINNNEIKSSLIELSENVSDVSEILYENDDLAHNLRSKISILLEDEMDESEREYDELDGDEDEQEN